MPLQKEISKFLLKILDKNIYTTFLPKLTNRNSSKMNQNNYKVPDECEFIFLHVPKTGGMTINHIIDEINKKHKSTKILRGGHNPISIFYSPNEKKYFTVVRDPIERIFSYYRMSLNDKKQTYHYLAKKSLYHFVAYCPEAQNIYCKYFSGDTEKVINSDLYTLAKLNAQNFYQILNFANLEENLKNFFNKIGEQEIIITNLNKSSNNLLIKDDDKKIIEFYNQYDCELYKFLKENNYLE